MLTMEQGGRSILLFGIPPSVAFTWYGLPTRLWFGYADPRIALRSPKTTGHDTLGFQDIGGQPKIPVLPTMSEVFAPLLATINRARIKRDATWVLSWPKARKWISQSSMRPGRKWTDTQLWTL